MIQHLLISSWRNLLANRFQSAIAILGLSIGIAAALLVALVVRYQTSFDQFISGYERTYRLVGIVTLHMPQQGATTQYFNNLPWALADQIQANIPEVNVGRTMFTDEDHGGPVELRRGTVSAREHIYWADPDIFEILPLPVLFGNLNTALIGPDGIVLPLSIARKYFGRDNVIGQTLQVKGHPMTVRAVIADLPANHTNLSTGIFASAKASFSDVVKAQSGPGITPGLLNAQIYLRLKPGAVMSSIERKLQTFANEPPFKFDNTDVAMPLLRIDRAGLFEGFNPGVHNRLTIMTGVGFAYPPCRIRQLHKSHDCKR